MTISCNKCGSLSYCKSGKMNGKQRYRCKDCGYNYTMTDRRRKYSDANRIQALLLYRKGLSLRSVADIIGTNDVTVLKWIRSFCKCIKEAVLSQSIEPTDSLDVIEIDEMWHYVKKSPENYGYGLLILVPESASLPLKQVLVARSHLKDCGRK